MRKVLIDPAALEEAAKWLEVHSSSSGSAEAFAADALREAIGQPAEAEGVEVVGYAVTWIRVGDTPEKTVFMSAADFDATGGPRFYSYREPLVLQSAHIAALSAVTAERDRLESMLIRTATRHFALQIKDRADDKKLDECLSEGIAMLEAERDRLAVELSESRVDASYYAARNEQLRAEVEALRKAAEPLETVHGDQLPPIGSKVLIHLSRSDAWVEHTVAGYYAWGDLDGDEHLHRVFVRVRDSDGYLNARLLKDVRPIGAAMAAKEA